MDAIITRGGTTSLTGLEKELMGSLISGTIPDWFQEVIDLSERSRARKEETEGTLDPQAQDTASTSSDVSASGITPSTFSTIPNDMPLQAVGALLNYTDAGNGEEPSYTPPDSKLPSSNIRNVGKRRLSDQEVLGQAKRPRQLNENMDLGVQVGQEAFGPHFLGPSTWHPSQPVNFFAPPLVLPGRYFPGAPTAIPAVSAGATPVMMPQAIFAAPNPAYYRPATFGAPLNAVGYPVLTAYALATPALPPFAAPEQKVNMKQQAPRRKTPGEKFYTVRPAGRSKLEDSADAARQRTINAHRANDARENDTDDIICLWKDNGAEQPCHFLFRGTEALLTHCVDQHGVTNAKDVKEKTSCAWADCPVFEITKGGLKRHLAESQFHARRGRLGTATTVEANVAA